MDRALRHRVNAARQAMRGQIRFFDKQRGEVAAEWKADASRVTFADFVISETLQKDLLRIFPEDQFFSEESSLEDEETPLESRYVWLVDPIDGTNNYALGMAPSAISLALLKLGHPIYGFVYDGSTGELFEGGPGQALLCNGKRVQLLRPPAGDPRIVGVHFPLPRGRSSDLQALIENERIRSLGSAALHLLYVAIGRLDGAIDERVREWDIAAAYAILLATERRIRFVNRDVFPMYSFRLSGPTCAYIAGTEAFLSDAQNWLG
jgi:myo-inositol-1(or 4)-monophosphatase